MNGDTRVDDVSKFKAALPPTISPYANELAIAAFNTQVSPWLLAGIMQRESNGGHALNPPGPTGTGDVHQRKPGTTYLTDGRYTVGPTGLPEDGLGWGRGLMQIDYGVHNAWATSVDWRNPLVSITKAGEILRGFLGFFATPPNAAIAVMIDKWRFTGLHDQKGVTIVQGWQDKYGLSNAGPYVDPRPLTDDALVRAALAAYNAGQSGVLEAVAAKLPADAPTSGNDYASWILNRVNAWEAAYASVA